MPRPTPRRGYSKRSAIPPAVLDRMNRGEEPTITLSEWLAVDQSVLVHEVLTDYELHTLAESARVLAAQQQRDGVGVMQRLRAIAAHFHTEVKEAKTRRRLSRALAEHVSDIPRQWSAFMLEHSAGMQINERMDAVMPFAADEHMGVREIAWMVLRPAVVPDVKLAVRELIDWAKHTDPNVRRCAIESTRPRGVWCAHIEELKQQPWLAEPLLERVMSDPSRYVQNSAANWLNDASKTAEGAAWVKRITKDWGKRSKTGPTEYIVKRALRTLRKDE